MSCTFKVSVSFMGTAIYSSSFDAYHYFTSQAVRLVEYDVFDLVAPLKSMINGGKQGKSAMEPSFARHYEQLVNHLRFKYGSIKNIDRKSLNTVTVTFSTNYGDSFFEPISYDIFLKNMDEARITKLFSSEFHEAVEDIAYAVESKFKEQQMFQVKFTTHLIDNMGLTKRMDFVGTVFDYVFPRVLCLPQELRNRLVSKMLSGRTYSKYDKIEFYNRTDSAATALSC